MSQYVGGAYRLDPFYRYDSVPEGGGLYRLSEIAPDRFFSSAYYLQYYRRTRLCDEVGLLAPLPGGSVAHLSFSRLDKAGPYRRRELRCLEHHSPVLLELLQIYCIFRQQRSARDRRSEEPQQLDRIIGARAEESLGVSLTRRETQIAGLVLQGHSNASAALVLGISHETSRVHRRNTYRKLNITSQRELFALLRDLL
ncbi:helix-turn-helix transcriptional regulator [uncultured Roseobacter sp.]|uniref:helix-turn-helix transcriptional regulator n=1 Tax=uncultured Roseobacter sp. TaxID=114847 RepID=UPI002623D257|nr:helix-turn-helix transcriptional regulator [uncultured Roseobacter sp.]